MSEFILMKIDYFVSTIYVYRKEMFFIQLLLYINIMKGVQVLSSTLKKEFNYKFLTDFDSYIQIMHLVSIYGLLQDAKIIKFSFYFFIYENSEYDEIQWYSGFKIKVSYEKCFYTSMFLL